MYNTFTGNGSFQSSGEGMRSYPPIFPVGKDKGKMPKKIHLICGSHIDPIWLWNLEDGAAEALSTFRIAAEFCEKNDDFIFCHNEALLYQWVEEYDPKLFERIRKLVLMGRWHIMGGWYLQPDCNLLSGESFVRQILKGKRYFLEKFGITPDIALNFDSFGHTRGLVQILKKSGYRGYLFSRPFAGQLDLPSEVFEWCGYDGGRIVAARLPGNGYATLKGMACDKIRKVIDAVPDGGVSFVVWGIGNHGGALSADDLEKISDLKRQEEKNCEIVHSTPEKLFDEITGVSHDIWAESLNPCMVGCYTTMSRIKQKYRKCENMLLSTEKMCTHAADAAGIRYPMEKLHNAEKELLTVQFHDAIAGTSVKDAENALMDMLGKAERLLTQARFGAFVALCSGQKKAYPDAIPIMAYNPFPYEIEEDFSCDLVLWEQDRTGDFLYPEVYDENGIMVPTQPEKENSTIAIEWAKKVVFHTRLKPMSINRFDCRFRRMEKKPLPDVLTNGNAFILDNAGEHVEIDCKTGCIRLYRKGNIDVLKNACMLEVYRDNYDPWGMRQSQWDEKIGEFRLLSPEGVRDFAALENATDPVHIIEDGAVRTTVEAIFGYKTSRAVIQYIIPKTGGVELKIRVIWNEPEKMLRLRLPVAFKVNGTFGEQAYGREKLREDMSENCSQRYILQYGDAVGLIVYNNGTYGSAVDEKGKALLITLLRSPIYSAHPIKATGNIPQNRYCPFIDLGEHEFNFRFASGDPVSLCESAARKAAVMNDPPMILSLYPNGGGNLPVPGVQLKHDDAIELVAWKPAEDGRGRIIRLFNPTDIRREVELIFGRSWNVSFEPFEIKTLRLFEDKISETDLCETIIPSSERTPESR